MADAIFHSILSARASEISVLSVQRESILSVQSVQTASPTQVDATTTSFNAQTTSTVDSLESTTPIVTSPVVSPTPATSSISLSLTDVLPSSPVANGEASPTITPPAPTSSATITKAQGIASASASAAPIAAATASKGPSGAVIAVVVILLLLVVAAGGFFFWRRRRMTTRRAKSGLWLESPGYIGNTSAALETGQAQAAGQSMYMFEGKPNDGGSPPVPPKIITPPSEKTAFLAPGVLSAFPPTPTQFNSSPYATSQAPLAKPSIAYTPRPDSGPVLLYTTPKSDDAHSFVGGASFSLRRSSMASTHTAHLAYPSLSSPALPSSAGSVRTRSSLAPTLSQNRTFVVIRTFVPSMPDELQIAVGERVRVLNEYDDGWGYCEKVTPGDNAEDGKTGVIPLECLDRRAVGVPTPPVPMMSLNSSGNNTNSDTLSLQRTSKRFSSINAEFDARSPSAA